MANFIRSFVVRVKPQGVNPGGIVLIQSRTIIGKSLRSTQPSEPKPAPFDYKNKYYTYFRSLFDRTTHRFDENSKIVVVEAPIGAKKSEFACQLAQDLDMKHFPEPNMDYHYIQPNGFDLRTLDDKMPEDAKTYDHKNFNENPFHRNAGAFQIMMYEARYAQYIDALAHVLNTGQGVVLERSPYSDFVFLEAMYSQKYISKGVKSVYYQIRENTIDELMRPHLVVYLNVPYNQIKTRSKAITEPFLMEMERQYKEKYLRDISTHAELLVYDWTNGGEVEVVVEDIERLDFNKYEEREEPKMKDWRLPKEMDWADKRMIYTNNKAMMLNLFFLPRLDVPELLVSASDNADRLQIIDHHSELAYLDGYNNKSFTDLLFKNKLPKDDVHL